MKKNIFFLFSIVCAALGARNVDHLNQWLSGDASRDNIAGIKSLLRQGADINYRDDQGMTPLMSANSNKMMKFLIKNGAHVVSNKMFHSSKDYDSLAHNDIISSDNDYRIFLDKLLNLSDKKWSKYLLHSRINNHRYKLCDYQIEQNLSVRQGDDTCWAHVCIGAVDFLRGDETSVFVSSERRRREVVTSAFQVKFGKRSLLQARSENNDFLSFEKSVGGGNFDYMVKLIHTNSYLKRYLVDSYTDRLRSDLILIKDADTIKQLFFKPDMYHVSTKQHLHSVIKDFVAFPDIYEPLVDFCLGKIDQLIVIDSFRTGSYEHVIAIKITWKNGGLYFQIKDSSDADSYMDSLIKDECNYLDEGIMGLSFLLKKMKLLSNNERAKNSAMYAFNPPQKWNNSLKQKSFWSGWCCWSSADSVY